jgi:hypothetical protein
VVCSSEWPGRDSSVSCLISDGVPSWRAAMFGKESLGELPVYYLWDSWEDIAGLFSSFLVMLLKAGSMMEYT